MNNGNRMKKWKKVWSEAKVIQTLGNKSDVGFEWRKNTKYPEYYEDIFVRYQDGKVDYATGNEYEYISNLWSKLSEE